ncbi:MAG: hypothetical protein ABFD79_14850, partial [Phycisphaerales bacterium]
MIDISTKLYGYKVEMSTYCHIKNTSIKVLIKVLAIRFVKRDQQTRVLLIGMVSGITNNTTNAINTT